MDWLLGNVNSKSCVADRPVSVPMTLIDVGRQDTRDQIVQMISVTILVRPRITLMAFSHASSVCLAAVYL